VKLDVDTLLTVPDAPPGAGPDRALDPPPPDPKPPAALLPGTGCPDVAEADVAVAAVAEGDVAQPAESPITAHISAAATIHPLLLLDSNRRTLGRRAGLAMVTEADQSGEDAGAAPAAPEPPATDGPDVALMVNLRENMETTPSVRWEHTPNLASRAKTPPEKG
jgi:hypothetical protein